MLELGWNHDPSQRPSCGSVTSVLLQLVVEQRYAEIECDEQFKVPEAAASVVPNSESLLSLYASELKEPSTREPEELADAAS